MNKLEEILFLKNIRGVGKAKIYKTYWGFLQLCTTIEDLKTAVSDQGISQDNIEKALHKTETEMKKLQLMQDTSVITVFDETYPQKLNVMKEKRPLIFYT